LNKKSYFRLAKPEKARLLEVNKHFEGKRNDKRAFLVSFFVLCEFCDYPSWIASEGQTLAQLPQSMHISGLIEYFSPSEIAP
jgi:hypothetical protein